MLDEQRETTHDKDVVSSERAVRNRWDRRGERTGADALDDRTLELEPLDVVSDQQLEGESLIILGVSERSVEVRERRWRATNDEVRRVVPESR